jgi:hypothetical protein
VNTPKQARQEAPGAYWRRWVGEGSFYCYDYFSTLHAVSFFGIDGRTLRAPLAGPFPSSEINIWLARRATSRFEDNSQIHPLGSELSREELARIRKPPPIQTQSMKHFEDEEHGDCS